MTHTPEPWAYDGDEDGDFVVWAGEKFVGNVGETTQAVFPPDKARDRVGFDIEQANARRIVACVNALAGIETSELEAGVIGEMVVALRKIALSLDEAVADEYEDVAVSSRDIATDALARLGKAP